MKSIIFFCLIIFSLSKTDSELNLESPWSTHFNKIFSEIKKIPMKKISVAVAEDSNVLEAVSIAKEKGIADAVLVGNEIKMKQIAKELNIDLSLFEIINEPDHRQAALKAVKLVHDGYCDMYMKGLLQTKDFLKSVLDKEVGLRTGAILSHVAVFEVKGISQLLFMTDGGFIIEPTLEEKVHLIENAVKVANACGIEKPKVAPLCAVEVVNPKMKCTTEAFELTKLNEKGKIKNCIVDGPMSMDMAISREACEHKGTLDRKITGDADILLFPDIHSNNIAAKFVAHTAEHYAGMILSGTSAPVILTSRSDDIKTKVSSIAFASYIAENMKKMKK
jgi:phosphate butyryltransferase